MDLVALLTEVALKFASLPGSRFALLVCHVGGITGREQGLQELCVRVLLWGLGLFLESPAECRLVCASSFLILFVARALCCCHLLL